MIADTELTTDEACGLLGISDEWINQVSKKGYYKKIAKGRWRLGDVVQGYIKYLQDEDRRASKTAANSRVQDARAADIELRTAERLRQVMRTEEVIDLAHAVFGALRMKADGVGARCTRDLNMRHKIESEVDDILTGASDQIERWAADLEASRGNPAPGRPYNS